MLKRRLNELKEFPSAIAGLCIIFFLLLLAAYAIITIPHEEAIMRWRGGEGVWYDHPRNASPAIVNWIPGINRSETQKVSSVDEPDLKEKEQVSEEMTEFSISMPFSYDYDEFPREVNLFFTAEYEDRRPHIEVVWKTPDGREYELMDGTVRDGSSYRISQDRQLQSRQLDDLSPQVGLFAEETTEPPQVLQGDYELKITGFLFGDDTEFDAELINYGQVHGLAGTDHRRRDIGFALIYGTPIALSFGVLVAVGANLSTIIIGAIGVWFGKWVDAIIQKLTEINMILHPIAVLAMVGTLYSRSIWVMLGVVIALNIFSPVLKNYRALYLQIREAPYIEAARSYGAGNWRIIFRYMLPRAVPVLVPGFVTMIPGIVFLEATLALLALGDPVLPTWGKVLQDAQQQGALYSGYYYWVLAPAFLLILTGVGFTLVGYALDRILNPRLRGM